MALDLPFQLISFDLSRYQNSIAVWKQEESSATAGPYRLCRVRLLIKSFVLYGPDQPDAGISLSDVLLLLLLIFLWIFIVIMLA